MQPTAQRESRPLHSYDGLMIIAVLFLFIFELKAFFLPHPISHHALIYRALINSILLVPGAVGISGSLFLALHAFFTVTTRRWKHLLLAIVACCLLLAAFLSYYSPFVTINKELIRMDAGRVESVNSYLPKFVDETRNGLTQEKRGFAAKAAYVMYGVRLPYRQDDNTWTYYQPTPQDVSDVQAGTNLDATIVKVQILSSGLLAGAGNVVYLAAVTFLISLIWAGIRFPREITHHAACP